LASAGLLEGKLATTHWASLHALEARGAVPVRDQRIVHSGKIVTGAGVSAGIDLALWLVGKIAGDDVARAAQLMIEYDPQPPYDSGSTAKADSATMRKVAAIVSREGADAVANEAGAFLREVIAQSQLAWGAAVQKARSRRRLLSRRPREAASV
ncbi:MAG: DJ-1/PfpI family protein, partial [Nocardiaceae bacterium]|nr:DJ-1/PfpI family protein [Nocardiaceae bacterium]